MKTYIYKVSREKDDPKLTLIKEKKNYLEKDIQNNVEHNLEQIFGLKIVKSEFIVGEFRVDTLAYDEETKSFVIIEYKKDKNFSVVDQGFSYLSILLNRKSDFVLEYNQNLKANNGINDFNWESSRVIFIAPEFTTYQINSINFKNIPFELWQAEIFEENLFTLSKIEVVSSKEKLPNDIFNTGGSSNSTSPLKEIKVYTIQDLINENWKKSQELYDQFSDKVSNLDERIKIKFTQDYIGFNVENKNLVTIHPQKARLVLDLVRVKPEDLDDPRKKVFYREKSLENYNVNISRMYIENESDIEYAMFLAEQVLKLYF